MERGSLRVRRQIARINGAVVEAPLKTKNAYRTLPLAKDTVDVLMQQKKKVGSSPWVFPGSTGGPMSPDSVLHMLHRVLKRAGLPRVRFHDLRHPYVKHTTKKYNSEKQKTQTTNYFDSLGFLFSFNSLSLTKLKLIYQLTKKALRPSINFQMSLFSSYSISNNLFNAFDIHFDLFEDLSRS